MLSLSGSVEISFYYETDKVIQTSDKWKLFSFIEFYIKLTPCNRQAYIIVRRKKTVEGTVSFRDWIFPTLTIYIFVLETDNSALNIRCNNAVKHEFNRNVLVQCSRQVDKRRPWETPWRAYFAPGRCCSKSDSWHSRKSYMYIAGKNVGNKKLLKEY